MKFRLLTILSALSLLLAICVIGPWVHGYWLGDIRAARISFTSCPQPDLYRVRTFGALWAGGQLGCGMSSSDFDLSRGGERGWDDGFRASLRRGGLDWGYWGLAAIAPIASASTFGFGAEHLSTTQPSRQDESWMYAVPVWFPLLLCLALPSCWLARQCRLRSRRLRHCCLQCGYDLRASKERCPECGAPIPADGTERVTSHNEFEGE